MFIAVLVTIDRRWKEPKCSSTDERINKMSYTCNDILVSKRNGILIHALTWMKLPNTILSEIKQTQKGKYCMIPLIWGTWNRQIHRDRK